MIDLINKQDVLMMLEEHSRGTDNNAYRQCIRDIWKAVSVMPTYCEIEQYVEDVDL